jgi:hypothetical protein
LIVVNDGGVVVRTALGSLLRRRAGCFDLLVGDDSVDVHLVGHVGGDGMCIVGVRW